EIHFGPLLPAKAVNTCGIRGELAQETLCVLRAGGLSIQLEILKLDSQRISEGMPVKIATAEGIIEAKLGTLVTSVENSGSEAAQLYHAVIENTELSEDLKLDRADIILLTGK